MILYFQMNPRNQASQFKTPNLGRLRLRLFQYYYEVEGVVYFGLLGTMFMAVKPKSDVGFAGDRDP